MKSEEDKKSRPVRIRMTQDQYKHVKEKADEQNLTFSAYVVEAVVKGNNYVILFSEQGYSDYRTRARCDSAGSFRGDVPRKTENVPDTAILYLIKPVR